MRAMWQAADIEYAVDLQARSYALLKWMAQGIARGFLSFDTAHTCALDARAAEAWIGRHYADLPPAARPPLEHLHAFCRLFVSYSDDSWQWLREPGQRLYSPGAHCFCAMCSRQVDRPALRARPLTDGDRRRADRQMRACLDDLALEHERVLEAHEVSALMRDPPLRETVALYAYAHTLLRRVRGGGHEAGVPLALWRRFAWTAQGAPKRKFRLSTQAIVAARAALHRRLAESV